MVHITYWTLGVLIFIAIMSTLISLLNWRLERCNRLKIDRALEAVFDLESEVNQLRAQSDAQSQDLDACENRLGAIAVEMASVRERLGSDDITSVFTESLRQQQRERDHFTTVQHGGIWRAWRWLIHGGA